MKKWKKRRSGQPALGYLFGSTRSVKVTNCQRNQFADLTMVQKSENFVREPCWGPYETEIGNKKEQIKNILRLGSSWIVFSVGVYNFILLKGSIKIFYISNEPSIHEMSPPFNEISPVTNIKSNFHIKE